MTILIKQKELFKYHYIHLRFILKIKIVSFYLSCQASFLIELFNLQSN